LGESALKGSDLVEVSSGLLRSFSESTGLSVNLGVLAGDKVLYLVRQRGAALVSANLQAGSTLPSVYTSLGKVMLAFGDPVIVEAIMRGWDFSRPPATGSVKSKTALNRQLAQVRVNGYSVQDEEIAQGLRAVAVPIRGDGGRVIAAINLASATSDSSLSVLLDVHKQPLLDLARELSFRLGYKPEFL